MADQMVADHFKFFKRLSSTNFTSSILEYVDSVYIVPKQFLLLLLVYLVDIVDVFFWSFNFSNDFKNVTVLFIEVIIFIAPIP